MNPLNPLTLLPMISLLAISTLGLTACADATQQASHGSTPSTQAAEYKPVRVARTGSLIDHAVVAHTDDDDDSPSAQSSGATSVSQLLNGNSASGGSKAGMFKN